jgi:hypothetical protein
VHILNGGLQELTWASVGLFHLNVGRIDDDDGNNNNNNSLLTFFIAVILNLR